MSESALKPSALGTGPDAEGAPERLPEQGTAVRIRHLPDGVFRDGLQHGCSGRYLRLEVSGPEMVLGSLLEIESGTTIYLGEVQRRRESSYEVFVEHSLDRERLSMIREPWL